MRVKQKTEQKWTSQKGKEKGFQKNWQMSSWETSENQEGECLDAEKCLVTEKKEFRNLKHPEEKMKFRSGVDATWFQNHCC